MDEQLHRVVSIAETLIAIDTTSHRSNLELIDFVAEYLRKLGVPSQRTASTCGKASLFANVGPFVAGGVILSGHTDVVPVTGQNWSTDPFKLVLRDDCFYGRGTADMKFFLACALAQVPYFLESNPRRPLQLAFSRDEEIGCLGTAELIKELRTTLPHAAVAIVGEPTEMQVANEHKGFVAHRVTVAGHPAHSSLTHAGVSAVMAAGRMVAYLAERAELLTTTGVRSGGFAPPYSSLSVNQVEGGTALNILAGHASFTWDLRPVPDENPEAIVDSFIEFARSIVLPDMQRIAKDCGIEISCMAHAPAFRTEQSSPAIALAHACASTGVLVALAFTTEAGFFQKSGYPTCVCGPGSIAQAHKSDEFISVEQVKRCIGFLAAVCKTLC